MLAIRCCPQFTSAGTVADERGIGLLRVHIRRAIDLPDVNMFKSLEAYGNFGIFIIILDLFNVVLRLNTNYPSTPCDVLLRIARDLIGCCVVLISL